MPLLDVARLSTAYAPTTGKDRVMLHDVVPVAGCQVVPPSEETSTSVTMPPPATEAVPDTTKFGAFEVNPGAGVVMVDVSEIPVPLRTME